ncbi:hypothetical protein [Companilactobacillus mishanensis]|uniref:Polysaccharide polymerase n=1 Tax=Companilactobacillus mishanensis TaxID=2486008 RepID=A0ABW9P879_9LACO|nr:hypothetical protein [Companilactobacillus mishanensis]MQS45431.1 hypothetical protein [Companilactobacillus mishanensis]
MLNRIQLNKLDGILFVCGYVPVLILGILSTSSISYSLPIEFFSKMVIAFSIILYTAKILINEYQIKEFFLYLVLLIVFFVSYRQSGSWSLITMFIFMASSRNVDPKLVNKIYFVISLVLIIAIVFGALKGIIPNYVFYRDGLSRASLGIIYPTDFASHIFYLLCSFSYLRGKKFGIIDFVLVIGISYLVYTQTNARLNFICGILLALAMYLVRCDKKNLLNNFTRMMPTAGAVTMIFLTTIYNPGNDFLNNLNQALSGRLSIVHEVVSQYGLHLFGANIVQNGLGGPSGLNFNPFLTKYVFIDSMYLRFLLMYGIVSLILVLIVLYFMVKKVQDKYLLAVLLTIFVAAAIENHLLEFAYNPFLIILASAFFNRNNLPNSCFSKSEIKDFGDDFEEWEDTSTNTETPLLQPECTQQKSNWGKPL